MYISKMTVTHEDKRAIMELQHAATEKAKAIEAAHADSASEEAFTKAFDEYNAISRKLFDLRESIRQRYVQELSQDKSKALENASEILQAYTKEDYRKEAAQANEWATVKLANYSKLFEQEPSYRDVPELKHEEEYYKRVKATSGYNFKGAVTRLTTITNNEREALVLGGFGTAELDAMIEKRASDFYKPRKGKATTPLIQEAQLGRNANYILDDFLSPEYMSYYGGPITNMLASITSKGVAPKKTGDIKITKSTGRSVYTYTLTADGAQGIISGLVPSSQKVFLAILEQFAAQNHYRAAEGTPLNTTVTISLKDFARMRGERVDEEPKATSEEALKESQRAKDTLDNFRKKTKKDLDTIYRLSVDGQEPGKSRKQPIDFFRARVIDYAAIKKGNIVVNISQPFAAYLVHSYVINAPRSLHKLPETNPNCLAIGIKLSTHSSNDVNKAAGTSNIIGVKTLLEAAPAIQSYEQFLASGNRNWKRNIRERLEEALELNVDSGVISEWYYCGSKGAKVSDAVLESSSYQSYENLYICFKMKDPPDDSERLKRKAADKKKPAQRRHKSGKVSTQ